MTYLSREMSLGDLSESILIITYTTDAQINGKKQVELKKKYFFFNLNLIWCNYKPINGDNHL